MLFNSWTFAVFLAVTFLCYHFLPWPKGSRVFWQIGLLTVASYVFYAWHTPWLVVILAISTWINAQTTLRLLDAQSSPATRRLWVIGAVVANLGFLAFFKYASLIIETFLPGSWWGQWGFDPTQIPLPVGISFYTFQGISLVIDIYRAGPGGIAGLAPPSDSKERKQLFLGTAFFKAFFPQLVAGPIVKAHEFMHQIASKRFASIQWDLAVRNLITGYFLKMVVADNLKEATAALSYPTFVGMPGINLLFLLYGYSFQIFADFAGYSLIAIGLARLFGYRLPVNFNFPYLSHSITEFWKRWHISLSTWLKEYLYFPLGGNRKGAFRTYVNLIVVMLLGGLWHGAASWRAGRFGWLVGGLQIFVTFNLVSFLWLLFQLPDFSQVLVYLRELRAWHPGFAPQSIYAILVFGLPVILYHVWGHLRVRVISNVAHDSRTARWALDLVYAVMLFLILTNSGSPGEFIYFQF